MHDFEGRRSEDFEKALGYLDQDKTEELKAFLLNNQRLEDEYSTSIRTSRHEYRDGDEVCEEKISTEKNLMWFAIHKNKPQGFKVILDVWNSLENCEKISTTDTRTSYFFGQSSSSSDSKSHKNAIEVAEAHQASKAVKQIIFDYICEKNEYSKYREFIKKNLLVLNMSKFNSHDFNFFGETIGENERLGLKQSLSKKGIDVSEWYITSEDFYNAVINKNYVPNPIEMKVALSGGALDDEKIRKMYHMLKDNVGAKYVLQTLLDSPALREEKGKIDEKKMEERNKKLFEEEKKKREARTQPQPASSSNHSNKRKAEEGEDKKSKKSKTNQSNITNFFRVNTQSRPFQEDAQVPAPAAPPQAQDQVVHEKEKANRPGQ